MKWNHVRLYIMALRRVVTLGVGVMIGVGLLLGISHIPTAYASCAVNDFVCTNTPYGGPGGDGQWDGSVKLNRTNGPDGSNNSSAPTTVAAGTTFNYTIHYDVHHTSVAPIQLWVIINGPVTITSADSPSPSGWPALENNACGAGSGLGPEYCSGTNLSPSCPSFYYASLSNYYSGAIGTGYAGRPYRRGVDPDFGHEVSCYGAQSIIWPFNVNGTSVPGSAGDENFSIQIPSTVHDANFSVRAYLSETNLTNVYARSAPQEFQVQPTTFNGNVSSSRTAATGRPLGGVVMNISDCGSTVFDQVATDGNGNYQFPMGSASVGQGVCIAPASGSFTAGDGSKYNGYSPGSGYNTSCPNANASCGGKDFVFNPAGQTPSITKTSSAAGGNLSPGATDTFTVTISNPYDANLPNTNIYDYIPVNIDPNTVSQGSAILSQSGSPPGGWGWTFCSSSLCTRSISWPAGTWGASFSIGMNGDTASQFVQSSVSNGCTVCDGNRPVAAWNFTTLPAYSHVQYTFSGKVKAANSVMPAPNPGVYCAAAAEPTLSDYYNNFTGVKQVCPDPNVANDNQGVWNRGYVSQNGSPPNTADTYDPVPGCTPSTCAGSSSICIGKTYNSNDSFLGNDSQETGQTPQYRSVCGVNVIDNSDNFAGGLVNGVHYIYSDPLSNGGAVDAGAFSTQTEVNSPPSLGPTMYTVDDQPGSANGGNLDPAMTETGCTNCTPSSAAPPQHLSTPPPLYNSTDYANGWGPAWNFDVNWASTPAAQAAHPIGANATNQAVLTVINLAIPGHPQYQYLSNTVAVKHVNVIRPGVDVTNNNVASGAGYYVDPSDQVCNLPQGYNPLTPSPIVGTIFTNPSTGQYVVGAGGAIGNNSYNGTPIEGFNSNNGLNTLSQNNYGPICLPDLQKIVSTFSSSTSAPGNTYHNGDDTGNGYGGKVVKAPVGDFNLGTPGGGPITINQRFTLYVQGNLYIGNNVSFGTGGSMAVVVTGNIYVNHNVTNVDGFYYARGGTINTCEDAPGVTLGQGPGTLSQVQCSGTLTINGFLLGQDLRLNRSPTSGYGEKINFSPQLYLNTPPGLSNLGLNVLGTYSIESPRY